MDEGMLSRDEFDLLAASLRANAADTSTWMNVLGEKLLVSLPQRVLLHRGGLFNRGPISSIAADLGSWRYAVRLEHGQPVAERTHVVRGIALKTEMLPLDAWLDGLTQALAELAETSERERAAVMQLLLG